MHQSFFWQPAGGVSLLRIRCRTGRQAHPHNAQDTIILTHVLTFNQSINLSINATSAQSDTVNACIQDHLSCIFLDQIAKMLPLHDDRGVTLPIVGSLLFHLSPIFVGIIIVKSGSYNIACFVISCTPTSSLAPASTLAPACALISATQ